jgi:pseudouridine-5'-phosphate glycosidase
VDVSDVVCSAEVSDALESGLPVVALESTIISHGLPYPDNLAAANEFESILRDRGVTPATIAVIDGVPRAGLSASDLEKLASGDGVTKASVRDLPLITATGGTGATTVAATAFLAARAGIRVFATGGLGGVHRDAQSTFDESADLPILAQSPVCVVSAGVKSVLDIPATLERLETLSVPVVGYRTTYFPAFWLPSSGLELEWSVDSADEVAAMLRQQDLFGVSSGLLVANPVPDDKAWNQVDHDRIVGNAFAAAERDGIRGKDVTPFLLDYIQRESDGVSLRVNLDVVRNNVAVAAEIAQAYAKQGRP